MVIIITAKVIYITSSDNEGRSERCLCVFVMGNVLPGEGFACALILGRVISFPRLGFWWSAGTVREECGEYRFGLVRCV